MSSPRRFGRGRPPSSELSSATQQCSLMMHRCGGVKAMLSLLSLRDRGPDGGGVAEQGEATDGGAGPEDRARLAAFGLRIKLLRVSRSWSQEQLAEAAGMHRTFIGQVERGQRGLNVLGLWRLAGAFNIPIGDLFLDVEGRPIP
jgi:DNA-binding XRE family transcriptional regulator